jgi:oligopeptide transport system substrate-binding protein
MRRVLLIPTVFLLLLGALCYILSAGPGTARTGSADPSHDPVVICSTDEIKTLDPGKMTWQADIRAAMGLWEGLASYDPVTLEPRPATAESWDISPDRMTYTFHLRPSARWSNGDPVRAADFLFAWKRILIPATGAQYIELFNCIAGAKEYAAALAAPTPPDLAASKFLTRGVTAPDDHTLVVHLASPTSYFLDLVAFPPFYPLNEAAMRSFLIDHDSAKGYDGTWTQPPALVTNGPFQLTAWRVKQYMSLEPNPFYWDRSNVLCDRIYLRSIPKDERAALLAYQTGTVDLLTAVPQEFGDDLLTAQSHGQWPDVHYRPVFGSYYYILNCQRPPLDDKRIRKALALAINRNEIVDKVTRMHQMPLSLLVPPDSITGYHSPSALPVGGDLEQARRLLAEAGYPGGKGLRSLEILYTTDVPVHGRIAQSIGQMWKELGITVTFRGLERAGFSAARQIDHNFDIARGGWYGDYPDPTTWLDLCRSTNENNDSQFKSPAFDAVMDQAAGQHNPALRMNLLRDAESIIVNDELPVIPLYQYGDGYVYDDHKLAGCDVNVRLMMLLKYVHRIAPHSSGGAR